MTYTLALTPERQGYSFQDGSETLSVKLDGGASRYRKDILNAAAMVTVTWVLDAEEWEYLRAFYKVGVGSGSEPFYMDLLTDEDGLTTHLVYFVKNSLKLVEQSGLAYTVTATLEVILDNMDETTALALVESYEP